MSTFVLVHGAWHGAWCWERVAARLTARGHHVATPTLAGLGERAAELAPEIGLGAHADDVAAALRAAERPVVLVGHSYSGFVVRQAADRLPECVERLVLVDAWFGGDGQSLFDRAPEWFRSAMTDAAEDGWRLPPPPAELVGVTDPADRGWLEARLTPHPLATFTEPARLTGAVDRIPTTSIVVEPSILPFATWSTAAGYPTTTIGTGHDAMVTAPGALTEALVRGAVEGGGAATAG